MHGESTYFFAAGKVANVIVEHCDEDDCTLSNTDGPEYCSLSEDGSKYSVVNGSISIFKPGTCIVRIPSKMVFKCSFIGSFNKFEQAVHANCQITEVLST